MLINVKRLIKITKIKLQKKHVYFASKANFSVRTKFDGYNRLGADSWLDGRIGYGSYIGDNCLIEASVGKYCSIGHNVKVLTGTHPAHQFVSTSPCFFSTAKQNGFTYVSEQKFKEKIYADDKNKYGVIIGNDVWIGYGAVLIGGVIIGDGAIVGATAYVDKDVEPFSIVVGHPAKKIGMRFSEKDIEYLLKLRWWDKSEEWIRENANNFYNVNALRGGKVQ